MSQFKTIKIQTLKFCFLTACRCREIKPDEKSMIFVTKCPCDECVPLIKGAGIKQIYAGDVDAGKKKADISYMKFDELEGVSIFTVSVYMYCILKTGGSIDGRVE